MSTAADVSEALAQLKYFGVLGAWHCDLCDDDVPFRTALARTMIDGGRKRGVAYGEDESRRAHNRTRHPAPETSE